MANIPRETPEEQGFDEYGYPTGPTDFGATPEGPLPPPIPVDSTSIDNLAGFTGDLRELITEEGRCKRCNKPLDDHLHWEGFLPESIRPAKLKCPNFTT